MRLDKNKVALLVRSDYGQQMLAEGDRAQAGNPEKEQVWMLLVTEIEPDPRQPRRHFDEVSLNELAADIARRGILQPIMVRPEGERYRIIFGERRWRAAQIAGKPRIPCLVREMDEVAIRQAQLVENVVREDISDVERGLALRQLYDTLKAADRKVTWESVAQMVGLTRMRINHLYGLSSLPQEIIDMIQAKRLSGSHGVELARLDEKPESQLSLALEASRKDGNSSGYGLSVAQVRQRINELLEVPYSHRRTSTLTPLQIEQYSRELLVSLRPDLPAGSRQQLRETAQHILRFLDQEGEATGSTDFVKSTLQSSQEPDPPESNGQSVKLTLQKEERRAQK